MMLVWVMLLLALGCAAGQKNVTQDWTDLTFGLNGQSLTIGLGTPDNLVLRGNAFPVIVAADGTNTMMAAARVADAGGRVVAFNKEAYMQQCGNEATPATAPTCLLGINALRWAAGVPAAGGNVTAFRLAVTSGAVSATGLAALKTAATAAGFTIQLPSGYASNFVSDVSGLVSANGTRAADVLLTTSYVSFTATQRATLASFVQQLGGGIVLGGQAWSTGGNITEYAGNVLLAPLNCVQWAGQYGDARAIAVATTAPDPTPFNADLSAKAFLDHVQGTAVLPADTLTKVTATVTNAIKQASFTWATPASSPSAALWASFGSQLDTQLSTTASGWTCGSVDGTVPANQVAVAYLAKRQSDLLASQVTPLPCSSTFPGAPAAGATPLASATVSVNATFAGNYTGPMPPRGGTKWLSTGLWAPAGSVVTITIPAAVAATVKATGNNLGVQIGSHSDNISGKTSWCRLPYGMLQRWWFAPAAGGNTITAASGMGGLLYITVTWGNAFGPMDVTVTGAIQAPFFFKGRTTEADWRATLRTSPAPFAELGSEKFVFTVPSASVAALDTPQAVVDAWDAVLDGYADLTTFTRDRPRAERIVLDCDISAGWMHSGYPIMAYTSVADMFNIPKYIGRDNNWGFFHELGHNHQWSAWTLPNEGEVTCNLYSVWASENIMKMNRTTRMTSRASDQAAYFASGVFPTNFDTTNALYQLMQMQENFGGRLNYTGGWEFWSRFLKRMQELDGTQAVATDDAKIQTYVIEASKVANKNLAPFFKAWKFPVSAATESAVTGLPTLDFDPTAACGAECSNCCLPGSLSPTIEDICKQKVPAGWLFYSHMDSSGNDLGVNNAAAVGGNWTTLASTCAGNPYCLAINTGGWLKYAVKNQSLWSTSYSDACQGLLVKNDTTGAVLPAALASPSMLTDGGLCLAVQTSGALASGQSLALAACTGSSSQEFRSGTGTNKNRIQIVSTTTGSFCLDVYNAGSAAGTAVTLYTCSTGSNQRWAVDSAGRLVPAHATSMCLDTAGSSLAAGASLVINACSAAPSQQFVASNAVACTSKPTIGNGTFSCNASTPTGQTCAGTCNTGYAGSPMATCWNGIFTVSGTCDVSGPITRPSMMRIGTSLCMQVNGTNANSRRLALATCTGVSSQLWISGTGTNTKRIQTASGGTYCLDVSGSGTAAGSVVIIYSCTTGNNQKWTQDASGRWSPAHAPTMCLDTTGSSSTLGTLFVINKCSSAATQKIYAVAAARHLRRMLLR